MERSHQDNWAVKRCCSFYYCESIDAYGDRRKGSCDRNFRFDVTGNFVGKGNLVQDPLASPSCIVVLTTRTWIFASISVVRNVLRVRNRRTVRMDDTERRTAKRSRFDQTEPEPKRTSRFDRRSRSPPPQRPLDSRRSRSPIGRGSSSPATDAAKKAGLDPAAAAGMLSSELHVATKVDRESSCCGRQNKCPNPGQERHPTCRRSPDSIGMHI